MPNRRTRSLLAALTVAALAAIVPAAHAAPAAGLKAEYFDYTDLTGKVAERIDEKIDFDWNLNEPVPGVGEDFSVRWTGAVTPPATDTYTFVTRSDDGVRLWIDGQLVIDDWTLHAAAERSGVITLEGGKPYRLQMDYFDGKKHALAKLYWRTAQGPKEIVPASALAVSLPDAPPPIELPKDGGVAVDVTPSGEDAPSLPVPADVTTPAPGDLPAGLPGDSPGIVSYGGPLEPPAPPIAGQTFNAAPEGGEVLVRRPADGQLIPLEAGASLPVGTHVDARDGAVDIQTAPAEEVTRPTQDATFQGGMFRVGQAARGKKVVTIDLLHGEFAEVCGANSGRGSARRRGVLARSASRGPVAHAAGRSRVLRRLWGKGKGRFRTRGRHAAATVRGTEWSIADRCDETAVRVHEGVVDVENLLTGAIVTLRGGDRYAARG